VAHQDDEVLCQGKYFAIVAEAIHGEYVRCGDEVVVVALDDDENVILTIEPSAAFGEPTLILPGGSTDPDVPFAESANAELQEEVGYKAARLDFLGEIRPFSKYLTVRTYLFLARELTSSKLVGDEAYEIGVERVPLAEFESLMAAGRLLDARVIAALYLARAFLASRSA
jgi:ADP-ribose diphosphatase